MSEAANVPVTRRRFVCITAAAAGLALLPVSRAFAAVASPQVKIWRGVALGADAMLQLHHPDPAEAEKLIARSLAEVSRLEKIFSLYDPDSALSRLNRDGALAEPPVELVELMSDSVRFGKLTGGAFDVTVQPLWELYANHFAKPGADPAGPGKAGIEAALARVGYGSLEIGSREIRFARAGMAATLNGIAQGYITDRIVALLRDSGIDKSLVDMGETRAIGGRPDGGAWMVGLEDPRNPGQIAERIAIENLAVSTSGGYGTLFDPAGRFNHILDPATGATSSRYLAVSVVARTSTAADALSTAFTLLPLDATRRLAESVGVRAHLALADGTRLIQGALPA
jgi:thiamine biosynthesis lipoprotein